MYRKKLKTYFPKPYKYFNLKTKRLKPAKRNTS
ncbi:MAG: hypothetical protein QOD00_167 [Blastocatellia bacterium]|nr:hypothetical protein [Blastocatellia bacterium]